MSLRSVRSISRALWHLALGSMSALGSFALMSSPGCGTEALGVEDCRDIERARCEAAAPCGLIDDVGECQRFYRDHCLHGLPLAAPDRTHVEQCVTALQKLGECAKTGGPEAELADCPEVLVSSGSLTCEVIRTPELAHACSFLTGKPTTPAEGGEGGDGGTAGQGG